MPTHLFFPLMGGGGKPRKPDGLFFFAAFFAAFLTVLCLTAPTFFLEGDTSPPYWGQVVEECAAS